MPAIVGNTGIVATGSASQINLDHPTNDASNVLLLLIVAQHSSPPTINTPSGWTLITSATVGTVDNLANLFWRVGGVSGSLTVTGTGAVGLYGGMLVLSDCDQSSPFTGPSSAADGSPQLTHTATAITPSVVNELLLGVWAGALTLDGFTPPSSMNAEASQQGSLGTLNRLPILIASETWAPASTTGTRVARTNFNELARNLLLGFKPYPGPSTPALTYPIGGESLTAGAVVNITWIASTSPTALASTLKYNIDYSSNYGGTWTSVVALTSTGVVTYPWTVPATIGAGYLIRIRSNDPAASLFSLNYDISGPFSVVTEAAVLGAPVITSPVSGSVNNKAVNVTVAWAHQGGPGNPQVAFTLQWANNVAFTSPTTVGPTTTGTQSTSIDFSAQASGTTIYVRVKTQGVSVYSAYSSIRSFVVGSLPATPNITAPTAGSPPTVPLPTVTFTEADTFVSRKMRITQGGSEVYNSGDVVSSALSFVSPFSFSNGVAYVLLLSVKNPLGLSSAEDSETFTAAYTGPATPTLVVTAVNVGGYVSAAITNSDTPSYNELWRYVSTASITTAIKVGTGIPVDGGFADYHVASGVTYKYFARAYAVTGLFTDSTVSSAVGVTLPNVFLHAVSRTSTSGNTDGQAISLLNTEGRWAPEEVRTSVGLLGRTASASLLGQAVGHRLSVTAAIIDYSQIDTVLAVWRKQETGSIVCVRDNKGNRIFGKMSQPSVQDNSSHLMLSFEVVESAYVEGL